MDEEQGFEMDPAIAEAMGFAGFGMQPGRKRKFNANDAFVDPATKSTAASQAQGSGGTAANSTPLGNKSTSLQAAASSVAQKQQAPSQLGDAPAATSQIDPTQRVDLQALRKGVKNERGDMVYFMPSFLEDPNNTELQGFVQSRKYFLNVARKHLELRTTYASHYHARKLPQARKYIENLLGYTFKDTNNIDEAFWAFPGPLSHGRYLVDGNKHLAVVGDAVFYLVVKNECYEAGIANDRYQDMSKNKFLGNLPHAFNVADFLIMNPGMNEASQYMRATAVEAVLGAVFKDCGGDFATLRRAVKAFGISLGINSR